MKRRYGAVRSASVAGTVTMICGPSERRVALVFSPPLGTGEYTVSTDPNVALGGGINVSAGGGVVEVSGDAYGDAPTRAWYGIASAAVTFGYVETVAE